jgi:hypothetical protein
LDTLPMSVRATLTKSARATSTATARLRVGRMAGCSAAQIVAVEYPDASRKSHIPPSVEPV